MELFSKSEEEPKRRLDLSYEGEVTAADWIERAEGEARDGCLGSGLPAVCLLDTLTPSQSYRPTQSKYRKRDINFPKSSVTHLFTRFQWQSQQHPWVKARITAENSATTPGKAALGHFVFSFWVGSVAT